MNSSIGFNFSIDHTESFTLKDVEFTVGENLTRYKFQVLIGLLQDYKDQCDQTNLLKNTYNDLQIELDEKNGILADNGRVIEELRQQERCEVSKFKQEAAQQLRVQCEKIVSLNARVQELTTLSTSLDAELCSIQYKTRELELANESLESEVERLTRELDCYRSNAGALRLEMKDLNATITNRTSVSMSLQQRLESLVKEVEDRCSEVESLRTELSQSKFTHEERELEYKSLLQGMENHNNEMRRQLEDSHNRVGNLELELQQQKLISDAQIHKIKEVASGNESKCQQLQSIVSELKITSENMANQLTKSNNERAIVDAQLYQTTLALEDALQKATHRQTTIDELNANLIQSQAEIQRMKCNIGEMESFRMNLEMELQKSLQELSEANIVHREHQEMKRRLTGYGEQLYRLNCLVEELIRSRDNALHGILQQYGRDDSSINILSSPQPTLPSGLDGEESLSHQVDHLWESVSRISWPEAYLSVIHSLLSSRDSRISQLLDELTCVQAAVEQISNSHNAAVDEWRKQQEGLEAKLFRKDAELVGRDRQIAELVEKETALRVNLDLKTMATNDLETRMRELSTTLSETQSTLRNQQQESNLYRAQADDTTARLEKEIKRLQRFESSVREGMFRKKAVIKELLHSMASWDDTMENLIRELTGSDNHSTLDVSSILSGPEDIDPNSDLVNIIEEEVHQMNDMICTLTKSSKYSQSIRRIVSEKDNRIHQLQETEKMLQNRIERQNEHQSRLNSELSEERRRSTQQIEELSSQVSLVQSNLDKIRDEIRTKTQECEKLNEMLSKSQSKIDELNNEISKKQKDGESIDREIAKRLRRLRDLNEAFMIAVNNQETVVHDMVRDFGTFEDLEGINASASTVVTEAGVGFRHELCLMEEYIHRLEKFLSLITVCRRLMARRDTIIAETRSENARLQQSEHRVTQQLDQTSILLEVTMNELNSVRLEGERNQREIQRLQDEEQKLRATLEIQKGRLTEEKRKLQLDIEAIQREAEEQSRRVDQWRSSLEGKISSLTMELEAVQSSKSSLLREVATCQRLLVGVNGELAAALKRRDNVLEQLIQDLSCPKNNETSEVKVPSVVGPGVDINPLTFGEESTRSLAHLLTVLESTVRYIDDFGKYRKEIKMIVFEKDHTIEDLQSKVDVNQARLNTAEQERRRIREESAQRLTNLETEISTMRSRETGMRDCIRKLSQHNKVLEQQMMQHQDSLYHVLREYGVDVTKIVSPGQWVAAEMAGSVHSDSLVSAFDKEICRLADNTDRFKELGQYESLLRGVLHDKSSSITTLNKNNTHLNEKCSALDNEIRQQNSILKGQQKENDNLRQQINEQNHLIEELRLRLSRLDNGLKPRLERFGMLIQVLLQYVKRRDDALEQALEQVIHDYHTEVAMVGSFANSSNNVLDRIDAVFDSQILNLEQLVRSGDNSLMYQVRRLQQSNPNVKNIENKTPTELNLIPRYDVSWTNLLRECEYNEQNERSKIVTNQQDGWRQLRREAAFVVQYNTNTININMDYLSLPCSNPFLESVKLLEKDQAKRRRHIEKLQIQEWNSFISIVCTIFENSSLKQKSAFIGLELTESDLSRHDNIPSIAIEGCGVRVLSVKGPAARDGLMVNDVITHLDDVSTSSLSVFKSMASKVKAGTTVKFSVLRNGVPTIVTVRTSELEKPISSRHHKSSGHMQAVQSDSGYSSSERSPAPTLIAPRSVTKSVTSSTTAVSVLKDSQILNRLTTHQIETKQISETFGN